MILTERWKVQFGDEWYAEKTKDETHRLNPESIAKVCPTCQILLHRGLSIIWTRRSHTFRSKTARRGPGNWTVSKLVSRSRGLSLTSIPQFAHPTRTGPGRSAHTEVQLYRPAGSSDRFCTDAQADARFSTSIMQRRRRRSEGYKSAPLWYLTWFKHDGIEIIVRTSCGV